MPALSFSAMEILQALLNHRKNQTIRLLTKETEQVKIIGKKPIRIEPFNANYRQPRLKVGDIVTLYWKQRSPFQRFCAKCGLGMALSQSLNSDVLRWRHCHCGMKREDGINTQTESEIKTFPKLLGKVKVTEVFEIEMGMDMDNWPSQNLRPVGWVKPIDNNKRKKLFLEELTKKDGFKTSTDMFNWFDKAYDLSTPKRFAVYRWKWL